MLLFEETSVLFRIDTNVQLWGITVTGSFLVFWVSKKKKKQFNNVKRIAQEIRQR